IILGKKNILTRASKNPIIQIIHVNFLVLINFITILLSAKFKLNKIAARWPAKAVAQLSFSQ
ncbi:MAG: hypothetical protein U0O16_04055, partial [Holdemanella sp.]